MRISKSKPILLTGATGYVAGWIAKKLLDEGFTVHAPIRHPEDKEKTKYLDAIAGKAPGVLKYFSADLLEPGSYDEAMKGCKIVIHTASPFILNSKNPKEDLIDPALKGTENVLESVNKTKTVKRVVLTSSIVAMYGDTKDLLNYPNQTITEEQWNTTASLSRSPYSYSKVLAEKKAWEISKAQSRWDLVVINPGFVLGPGINPNGTSESFTVVKQMGDGTMKMGAPEMNIGCVDVRDVAEAHFKAAFTPKAEGRYIVTAEGLSFLGLANLLQPKYGSKYPLPKKNAPKWLLVLIAPMVGMNRQFLRDNVGYPWKGDNSKSKQSLGMTYIPIKESINEFFQQAIDSGVFKK